MGLSGSKQTQTTNNRGTVTTTPTNPPWVTDSWRNYIGSVNDLFDSGSPSDLAPGTNANLEGAYAGVQGLLSPQYQSGIGQASDIAGRVAGYDPTMMGSSSWTDRSLDPYMNPYTQQVVDTTLADYDQSAAEQRARMAREAAGAGAFGGSRYGVAEGQFDADALRGRASTQAGLLDRAFGTAAGLREADTQREQQTGLTNAQLQEAQRNRELQAAGLLGELGLQGDSNTRSNLALAAQLGELEANRGLQDRLSPYTFLGLQGDLLNQLPAELFRGQIGTEDSTSKTVTRTGGGLLGSLLGIGGSLLSSGLLGGAGGFLGGGK